MNEQIKTKELPVDWLITDTHYESGNKEFVSIEKNYTDVQINKRDAENYEYLMQTGEQPIPLNVKPKETFGTRHIQLVFANPTPSIDPNGNKAIFPDYNSNSCIHLHNDKQYDKALKYHGQGKDYFIYEVTEER